MRIYDNYERLHFHQTINTIPASYFPTNYPVHWHRYVEITMLLPDASPKKFPVIKINQETYTLHPGDILFIWPGELHEIIENSEHVLTGLQFSGMYFNELPDFAPFTHLFKRIHLLKANGDPLSTLLMPHLEQIFALHHTKPIFYNIKTSICLSEMFIELGTYLRNTAVPAESGFVLSDSSLDKINIACRYIQENCDQPLTLDTVAGHVGFSSYYLSRLFKQSTTYSFVEYLTLHRIKRSQQLLADAGLSITDVSYQSGFSSISTFNRVFQQYLGCSPRDYRKYYLKGHEANEGYLE